MERVQVTESVLKLTEGRIGMMLTKRLNQKGFGAFASSHEILGVVTEEYHELCHAIESNESIAIQDELLDLAVAAIFGLASIDAGGMRW
jgi:hypothetical protein